MEILIGINPDTYDNDAMALGSLLARETGSQPLLVHVYSGAPAGDTSPWAQHLQAEAQAMLDDAVERFCSRWQWSADEVASEIYPQQSSGAGLAEVAATRGDSLIVIGSADGGATGRFAIGSTANQLLHSSIVPVVTAPSGYSRESGDHVSRLVVAYRVGDELGSESVKMAAGIASQLQVPIKLMTILLRPRMYSTRVQPQMEEQILDTMTSDATAAHNAVAAHFAGQVDVEAITIAADSVGQAFNRYPWQGDEILVVGSAQRGPIMRVFLGDMTHKLLRRSPVPVIVLPRD